MKKQFSLGLGLALIFASTLSLGAGEMKKQTTTKSQPQISNPAAQQTYKDIEKTLGFVPEFLRAYPQAGITGAWEEMKNFQMGTQTALSGKQKELIGLAVSSQVPCHYCTYFHTKAAKAGGATDMEIREALAVSALTRHWSTWLNGLNGDLAAFKGEVDRAFLNVKAKMDSGEKMPEFAANANTAEAVQADMKALFGFVPTFFQNVPDAAVVGAWRAQRDIMISPNTALTGKDKSLIGVAVASQIPCSYCNYFDTQAALKLDGATEAEIHEAIIMAGIVRHWSTVLNGNMINEQKFRAEVDRIFNRPMQRQLRTGSSTTMPDETEMTEPTQPQMQRQPSTAPAAQPQMQRQTPPPMPQQQPTTAPAPSR